MIAKGHQFALPNENSEIRRPIGVRCIRVFRDIASLLDAAGATPNDISRLGLAMSACAGLVFFLGGQASESRAFLFLFGVLFCNLRLLCNLLDGLMATELGRAQPNGHYWNEIPDRASDVMILAGLGYGIGAPGLGWAASCLAVFIAYLRVIGGGRDFRGPMAKPHRVGAVSAGATLAVLWDDASFSNQILEFTLWVIIAGGLVTGIRRIRRLAIQSHQGTGK